LGTVDDWQMIASTALGGHVAHVIVFGVPMLALLGAIGVQELRARLRARSSGSAVDRPERVLDQAGARAIAASSLVVSAAVHIAVAPEHFHEYLAYGIFFTLLAMAQLGVAVAFLLGPPRRLLVEVAIATAAVVLLWIASRTTGLPIGAERWTAEEVGLLDVVATTAEVITVIACCAAVAHAPRRIGARAHSPELAR
jgi:hypothetical protein